jgi:hypothetical protein
MCSGRRRVQCCPFVGPVFWMLVLTKTSLVKPLAARPLLLL